MQLLAQAGEGTRIAVSSGVGLGAVIAVTCSWERNKSIIWAIIAGLLSWIFVIYFALTRQPEETKRGGMRAP